RRLRGPGALNCRAGFAHLEGRGRRTRGSCGPEDVPVTLTALTRPGISRRVRDPGGRGEADRVDRAQVARRITRTDLERIASRGRHCHVRRERRGAHGPGRRGGQVVVVTRHRDVVGRRIPIETGGDRAEGANTQIGYGPRRRHIGRQRRGELYRGVVAVVAGRVVRAHVERVREVVLQAGKPDGGDTDAIP